MINHLTLFILIFAAVSATPAQGIVDKESYDYAVRTLKTETNIPLRVPTYFIVPPYFTRKDRKMPLLTSYWAEKESYSLMFCYTGVCQGSYNYGEVSGEKITDKTDELKFDKTVKLSGGITGYYQKSGCGSSCGNAWIFWRQDNYLYGISLIVDDLDTLIKVANSAIENNSVSRRIDTISLEDFLKATLKPGDTIEVETKGDLNGDGLTDWAGVINRKITPPIMRDGWEIGCIVQLYILLQQKRGGYVLAEKSKEEGTICSLLYHVDSLEIKRSSIFVLIKGSFRYGSFLQFKLYRGEWRLIGWRELDVPPEPDPMTEKDRNLLTGTVIETRKFEKHQPSVKRYKRKFPRILLKDFDLVGWGGIE